jgi:hypothetical protein
MLLTIEGRTPLFLDKQETTMSTITTKIGLSALALAVVAFTSSTFVADASASARGLHFDNAAANSGTANQGTANRGTSHRGTANRGTANRGISNRGTSP